MPWVFLLTVFTLYCFMGIALNRANSFNLGERLRRESGNMNNYHYVRNTRPQIFWLSLISSPKELRQLEEANF